MLEDNLENNKENSQDQNLDKNLNDNLANNLDNNSEENFIQSVSPLSVDNNLIEENLIEKKSKKRGLFWFTSRFIKFSIYSVVTIILLVLLLLNIKPTRQFVLKNSLDLVNQSIKGKIYCDDLRFRTFSDIELKNIIIITNQDTLLNAESLNLNFRLLRLINKEIIIDELKINNAKVSLIRYQKDSTWNFTHIAFPNSDTTTSPVPDLMINIIKLNIINSSIKLKDNTISIKKNTLNLSNFELDNLNLDLSLYSLLKNNYFNINIHKLGFNDKISNFSIENMKMSAFLSPQRITINNINMQTDKSLIEGKVSINNFDMFGIDTTKTIEFADLTAQLRTENFYPLEFFEILSLEYINIGGRLDLDIDLKGKLNNLNINRLKISATQTELDLIGTLKDLLTDNPKYELTSIDSDIYSNDIYNFVQYIPKDKIPLFKHLEISNLYAIGDTKGVKTTFDFDTKQGKLKGKFDYSFWDQVYDCDIKFENLNLNPFFNQELLLTDLTGDIKAKGKSFDLKQMEIDANLNLKNSKYINLNIGNLDLEVNSIGDGIINISKLEYTSKFTEIIPVSIIQNIKDSSIVLNVLKNNTENTTKNITLPKDSNFVDDVKLPVELKLNGKLNFQASKAAYNLDLQFKEFNLARFISNQNMPNSITSKFDINGRGFDLEDIFIDVKNETELLMFGDRAFIPFDVDILINNEQIEKKLNLVSDFVDLEINGKYGLIELFQHLSIQNLVLANFVNDKINNIIPKLDSIAPIELFEIEKIAKNSPIDCKVDINAKDMSILSAFIGNMYLHTLFKAELFIKSDSLNSATKINNLQIENLELIIDSTKLTLNDLLVNINLETDLIDNVTTFDNILIDISGNKPIILDNNELKLNKFNTVFRDKNFNFDVDLKYQKNIGIVSRGLGEIRGQSKNELDFYIDNLSLSFGDSLYWKNIDKIEILNKYNSFNIENLKLLGKQNDKIEIKGLIDFQNKFCKDLDINIFNLNLAEIQKLVESFDTKSEIKIDSTSNKKEIKKQKYEGNIEFLSLKIDDTFENPNLNLKTKINDIILNNESFGSLYAKLNHSSSIISGNLDIFSEKIGTDIDVEINSLPILLSIDNKSLDKRMNKNEELDIDLKLSKLSLKTVEAYVPAISDLNGLGYLDLKFGGNLPDNIDYNGNAKFENVNFLVDITNIRYNAEGSAKIAKELITLENIKVMNYESDLKKGAANVTGTIQLKGIDIDYLDISLATKNLMVMNQKAKKTLRWIYGDLRIATGNNPIRFFGSLKKPNVTGDVDVLFGDLVMPQEDVSQIIRSKFNYVIKGSEQDIKNKELILIDESKFNKKINNQFKYNKEEDKIILDTNKLSSEDEIEAEESKNSKLKKVIEEENVINSNKSFNDLINYDLNIKMPGVFKVNMVINAAIELFAELTNRDINKPLKYTKSRDEKDPKLFGDISVKESSRLSFFKSFKTSGNLYFTTGNLFNPNLDLVSNYKGRTTGSNPKDYLVNIKITGTKEKPIIEYSYILGDDRSAGDQSEVLQNVFYLLTLGNIKGQASNSGGFDLNKSTSDFANSMLADLATKQLNQVLSKSGINAEINFENGNIDQANIKISGQVFNIAQLSYGGRISDINSANEIQFQVPFSALFNVPLIKDMILQASYINTLNTIQTQDQKIWELKLKLGGSK